MKLKRDYIKNPLKRNEFPEPEDVKYLFLHLNYSKEECAKVCNCSPNKIQVVCKQNSFVKTKEQRTEQRRRTNLQKYGCINVSQNSSIKEKKKETTFKNYGVENPAQSRIVFNKIKETCLERYGVESSNSTQEKKQKIRETVLQKYNVDNVMKNVDIKKKQQNTCKKKYGYPNAISNPKIKQKRQKTCMERYGCKSLFGSIYFKTKVRQTFLQKYGVDNPMKIEEVVQKVKSNIDIVRRKILEKMPQTLEKIYVTKRKNKSFNTSKIEDDFYNLLCTKFNNVQRQYKTEKYPFLCDFYIPDIDLYIEYNGNWTHGKELFCYNNINHLIRLDYLIERSKTSDYYQQAIYTWTELDVKKQKTAKENNLNYLCFYNKKQFLDWFEKQ